MELFDIAYLFYFLPLFLGIYYLTPEKEKTIVTIVAGVIFYFLQDGTNIWQLGVLLGLIGGTFLAGTELRKPKRGFLLPISLLALASIWLFFRWYQHGAWFPIGMNFYILQMAAYLIDTYRKGSKQEPKLDSYSAQILLFPKLLGGPLVDTQQLQDQMDKPKVNQIRFRSGLQEVVFGLAIKVMLANRLSGLWDQAALIGYGNISTFFSWVALAGFALRLYFDFHGYSLMAVGLGKMMGFCLPRNFDNPYTARSVTDFFRRWHISLGIWIRKFLYIPLGGNRRGKWRTVLNVLLVWLFTGLRYGFQWKYVIWSCLVALLIINEKLWLGKLIKDRKLLSHIYTLFVVLISWLPFAVSDVSQIMDYLGRMFRFCGTVEWKLLLPYVAPLSVGIFFATPIPGKLFEDYREHFLCDCVLFVLFWVSIYFVSTAQQNPFLYFLF